MLKDAVDFDSETPDEKLEWRFAVLCHLSLITAELGRFDLIVQQSGPPGFAKMFDNHPSAQLVIDVRAIKLHYVSGK